MRLSRKNSALALGVFAFVASVQIASAFYDPHLGRWINRDPLGEYGSINLYEFVESDPVNGVDPYGLCSQADVDALAIAMGNSYAMPTRVAGQEFGGTLCCDCETGSAYAAPVQMGITVPNGDGASMQIVQYHNSKCKDGDREVGRWHTHPSGSDRQLGGNYAPDPVYPQRTGLPSYMTNARGETTVIWPVGGFFPEIVIDTPGKPKRKRL